MNEKRLCLALLVWVWGCTEFFSQDAVGIVLTINGPSDSLYNQPGVVTFWWEEDRAAERFRFQLVRSSFDNPAVLVDTLMEGTRLEWEGIEGLYTWRIRVENEGSESSWQERVLVLDNTAPLATTAQAPINGANLFVPDFSNALLWRSADLPIDGIQFPVPDSVYLYSWKDGTLRLLDQYFINMGKTQKQLNISGVVLAPLPGDTIHYRWLIKSFDQAGNAKLSETFSFSLYQ